MLSKVTARYYSQKQTKHPKTITTKLNGLPHGCPTARLRAKSEPGINADQVFVCGLIPCDAGAGAPVGTAALSPKESFLSPFSGPKPSRSFFTATQMQAVPVRRGAADGSQRAGRARKGGRTLPKIAGWLLRAHQHSLLPPSSSSCPQRVGTPSPKVLVYAAPAYTSLPFAPGSAVKYPLPGADPKPQLSGF